MINSALTPLILFGQSTGGSSSGQGRYEELSPYGVLAGQQARSPPMSAVLYCIASYRIIPHRTASYRIVPHRTIPHRSSCPMPLMPHVPSGAVVDTGATPHHAVRRCLRGCVTAQYHSSPSHPIPLDPIPSDLTSSKPTPSHLTSPHLTLNPTQSSGQRAAGSSSSGHDGSSSGQGGGSQSRLGKANQEDSATPLHHILTIYYLLLTRASTSS